MLDMAPKVNFDNFKDPVLDDFSVWEAEKSLEMHPYATEPIVQNMYNCKNILCVPESWHDCLF